MKYFSSLERGRGETDCAKNAKILLILLNISMFGFAQLKAKYLFSEYRSLDAISFFQSDTEIVL